MNRTYWIAAGLLGLSALISFTLWANGFPPEWSTDKGERVSAIRDFLTTPFTIVGVGACLTALMVLMKRGRLAEIGKTQRIAAMGILFMPILTLFLQVMMALMLYDVIGERGANFWFFLIAASFFLTMGNYIVTAEPNSRIGFRNKWTLADPVVWARTHRFFGRSLVIGTLMALPLGLLIDPEYATYALVGIAVSLKLISFLYARSLGQRLALRNT